MHGDIERTSVIVLHYLYLLCVNFRLYERISFQPACNFAVRPARLGSTALNKWFLAFIKPFRAQSLLSSPSDSFQLRQASKWRATKPCVLKIYTTFLPVAQMKHKQIMHFSYLLAKLSLFWSIFFNCLLKPILSSLFLKENIQHYIFE